MKSLAEVESEVARLAKALELANDDLPSWGGSRDLARPHIEVDDAGYHYVVVERGREQLRDTTTDFDELLYWIFSGATHKLAFSYEAAHRVDGQDSRRLAFARQLELLDRVDPSMAARRRAEIARILESAPYRDRAARA
jgi:hypothetical protein